MSVSIELNVITSREFLRMGAHGELDWNSSRELLSSLVKELMDRGTGLAILDVRDGISILTDLQIVALADIFISLGFTKNQRLAVLHAVRPHPQADVFAAAATRRGLDVGSFDSFEAAVDWLSASRAADPHFDRPIYNPPAGGKKNEPRDPPGGGHS